MTANETFLNDVFAHLKRRLAKYPHVTVKRNAAPAWPDHPRTLAPKADILIHDAKLNIVFLVQSMAGAEATQRITRCWPYLDAGQETATVIIQLWEKGAADATSRKLVQFMLDKLSALYPFYHETVEYRTQNAERLGARIVDAMIDAADDILWVRSGPMQDEEDEDEEDEDGYPRDIEEVFAEIERNRAI